MYIIIQLKKAWFIKQKIMCNSSAIDYSGQKGFVDDIVVFRMFDV